jgi:hypothetical protein
MKRLVWVPSLASAVYVLAQELSTSVLAATPLELPQVSLLRMPAGQRLAWRLVSALILAVGLIPVARRLAGRPAARWLVLATFLYLLHTVNTVLETTIFTSLGGQGYVVAAGLLPALLGAAVLVAVRPVGDASPGLADGPAGSGLAWRLGLCWLAWPFIYFACGAAIAPLVIRAYSAEGGGLKLPHASTLLAVQAIRSTLFLLPSLAVMEMWAGTRLGLWLALGWAHWALVGLSGLVMPTEFFSATLRLVHSLEIGADSFAYAGVLVALLAPRRRT